LASLTDINLTSSGKLSDQLHKLIKNKLWLQVIIGMLFGVAMGGKLGPNLGWVLTEPSLLVSSWLAFPGYLFLALIQMIVVPVVLAPVVRGLTAASSIALLLGVDRILDMCWTVVNVLGDITASGVVDKLTSQVEPLPVLQFE
jgi:Na+/H+-dicarboxylate symporter